MKLVEYLFARGDVSVTSTSVLRKGKIGSLARHKFRPERTGNINGNTQVRAETL